MITASLVLYHNAIQEVNTILHCALQSTIEKLYIIDNSRNDAFRILEQQSPKIRYIHSENVGYGSAHNIAIREAIVHGATYHVVLNPDIIFEPKVIDVLAAYMNAHPTVGQMMPKVYYPSGEIQYLCKLIPTPMDLIFKRFLPYSLTKKRLNKFQLKFTGYNKLMDVPFLSGCFMFLRVDTLREIGLFDERFFMYGEDIDLSRRIHARFRTVFYPEVTIIHAHEAASYKNKKMLLIHIRNIIRYFNKWGWFFDRERKHINHATLCKLRQNN